MDQTLEIPDSLFDEYANAMGDEGGTPAEEAEDSTDADEGDDNEAESDSEDGDADEVDDSEAGDDNEEDADDDADDSTDAESNEGSFFDRKEIDQISDPEARAVAIKAYKSMQAGLTAKTTELAEQRREVETVRQRAEEYEREYESFIADISTPEGAEHFLLTLAAEKPEHVPVSFLVDALLRDPEKYEEVQTQLAELLEDPKAQRLHQKETQQKIRDHRDKQRDQVAKREQAAQNRKAVDTLVTTTAGTHGTTSPAQLEVIRDRVDAMIQANSAAGKKTTRDDVVAVVEKTAKLLARTTASARENGKREVLKGKQEQVKKTAEQAKKKRPPPPVGGRAAAGKGKDFKAPEIRSRTIEEMVDFGFS